MAINPEQISNLTKNAYNVLKSKTLGGVSKESAQEAISAVVKKMSELADEAVGKVQQEMEVLRGKTAQEIAEITSKKDVVIFSTKKDAAKAIEKAKSEALEAIKKAKAPKTAERILPNGHKEVRKVNQNGAVMVKEYNEAGQLLSVNVTTLDGSIRRTYYNPITGKPVKTFTNTSGTDMLVEYPDGAMKKMTRVNNKKLKPQKPTIVSQSKVQYVKGEYLNETGAQFERIYSDGSKEVITRYYNSSDVSAVRATKIQRINKDGDLVYKKILYPENNHMRETIINGNKKISIESYDIDGVKQIIRNETLYDSSTGNYILTKASLTKGNEKTVYRALKDEFGFYTGKYTAKTIYIGDMTKKPVIKEVTMRELPVAW